MMNKVPVVGFHIYLQGEELGPNKTVCNQLMAID